MPPRPQFSIDESVEIVAWWYELKDIHKVRWRYAKEKGIEKCPRKIPSRKVFVIWTDEKIFLLHTCPNRQNERYWSPKGEDPEVEEACRVQGG